MNIIFPSVLYYVVNMFLLSLFCPSGSRDFRNQLILAQQGIPVNIGVCLSVCVWPCIDVGVQVSVDL